VRFQVLTAASTKLRIFYNALSYIPEDSELGSLNSNTRLFKMKLNKYNFFFENTALLFCVITFFRYVGIRKQIPRSHRSQCSGLYVFTFYHYVSNLSRMEDTVFIYADGMRYKTVTRMKFDGRRHGTICYE
jgi:hypothetical protein